MAVCLSAAGVRLAVLDASALPARNEIHARVLGTTSSGT
jgi:hypothetical protein